MKHNNTTPRKDAGKKKAMENQLWLRAQESTAGGLSSHVESVLQKLKPKPQTQESDSASSFPQAQRSQVNESERNQKETTSKKEIKLSEKSSLSNALVESEAVVNPGTPNSPKMPNGQYFKCGVVLIQEGLGNFGDSAYYSREALESGVALFEGKKLYVNHPSVSEEEDRPERSVRDILGHYENVHIAENENGQSELRANLVTMKGESYAWARELMEHAIEYAKKYPNKAFVGLSVNAFGDAEEMSMEELMKSGVPEGSLSKIEEAKGLGIQTVNYVSKFTDAVSCDLVTEAGAGGKFTELIEGARSMTKKKNAKAKESDAGKEAAQEQEQQQAAGHDDAAQDVALIKQMIAKHLGDGEISDEEAGIVKEAYEAHKEMGDSDEDSEKKACEYLKASKHMASKREAAKGDEQKDGNASEEAAKESSEADAKESGVTEAKETAVTESAKPVETEGEEKSETDLLKEENAKLKGELASFKESQKKAGLTAHIEKLCKESKLSNSVTSEFKKLVEKSKSVDEVNTAWKLFESGYRSRNAGQAEGLDFGAMVIGAEKSVALTESEGGVSLDLTNCQID